MGKKVIIGMSGGVDSSVAAYLLSQEGYSVEGLFMKNWEQDDKNGLCAAAQDLADAQAVCDKLKIPLHTINFAQTYWDKVFNHFLHELAASRTPNPDVICNKEIKFKVFFEYALSLGADLVATGHYAKLRQLDNKFQLLKAKDRDKDQTYFLHAIDQNVLTKTLFPVGKLLKTEVREIAKNLNLPTQNKKDSTGICFIGEKRFKQFLNEFMLAQPGDIYSSSGEKIGQHDGLMFYTIGQRQGLGIGGLKNNNDDPWYVAAKDIKENRLIVAQGKHHPMLYGHGLICTNMHWLSKPEDFPFTCTAKIRYRQNDEACVISPALESGQHCIIFANPQRAITPGQYIVFYDQNVCLGGAIIEQKIA